ncbi:hypothetical protein [Streptomyces sp. NPDC000983]|jgi:hypothetical protein|uniref:hypothetical protein n=1 Tax=Streptomyces sp. NPDC000983 TaxID=3154373 RepID=UPI00331FF287
MGAESSVITGLPEPERTAQVRRVSQLLFDYVDGFSSVMALRLLQGQGHVRGPQGHEARAMLGLKGIGDVGC